MGRRWRGEKRCRRRWGNGDGEGEVEKRGMEGVLGVCRESGGSANVVAREATFEILGLD
jgi:hypothetical protein